MSISKDEVYADDIYDEPSPPINPNTLIALQQLAIYTEGAKSVPRDQLDDRQRSLSGAMQDHLNDLLWGRAQFVKYNDLKLPPMIDILTMFHRIEAGLLEVEMVVSPVEVYEFERTNAFGFFHSMVSVFEAGGDKEFVHKKPVALWDRLKEERSVIVPMHEAYTLAHALVMARQEVITREHRLNLEDNPHKDQWTSKSEDFISSSPVIIEFFTQAVGVHKLAKKELHDYLKSFRWHDIKWEENVLNWSQQKEAIYEVLSKKQKFFPRGFWLSEKDLVSPSFPEGMKTTETLLALDEDGELIAGALRRVDGTENNLQIRIRPQRQFNQMVPALLEGSPARYQTIADKREEILKITRDQIQYSPEEDFTVFIEPEVFLNGVPNLSKTELHGILLALNQEKILDVEMEYPWAEIVPMNEEASPHQAGKSTVGMLRYKIRPNPETLAERKKTFEPILKALDVRLEGLDMAPEKDELENSQSADMNQIRYLNIVTDFGLKRAWNEADRNVHTGFHEDSAVMQLWKLLLEKKGNVLEKSFIKNHIEVTLGRDNEKKGINLIKAFENLQTKLKNVAGIERKDVASWFDETESTLFLKDLD